MKMRGYLGALAALGTIAVVIGIGLFVELGGKYLHAKDARSWCAVSAEITKQEISLQFGSHLSAFYTPEIHYSYSLNGKNYTGGDLGFLFRDRFEDTSTGRDEAERAASELTSYRRAFYNPRDPAQSVLSIDHDYAAEFRSEALGIVEICGGAFVVCAVLGGLIVSLDEKPAYLSEPEKGPIRPTDPTA